MIQRSTFVPQFDIAVDSLTTREHLFFMCELRMDRRVSKFQKNDRINDTLWKLGLMKVADSRISTLSGGERKTLNLATEVTVVLRSVFKRTYNFENSLQLLTDPQIIFCDEITTGCERFVPQIRIYLIFNTKFRIGQLQCLKCYQIITTID